MGHDRHPANHGAATRHRGLLIGLGVVAGIAVAAVLGQYVAAAAYFAQLRMMPPHLEPDTFWSLWQQLDTDPASHKKLLAAIGIAVLLVVVLPAFAIAAARQPKRPQHGAARFAHANEVRQAGLNGDQGIIVGKYSDDYLVFGGQQFVLLAAPTRSGKGVGVVIPNCLNWPDSLVVLDIKMQNFEKTSGFRAQHGQQVFLFNPSSAEFRIHRWNPLLAISRSANFRIGDIQAIAESFYPTHGADQRDAFWYDQAQNLFVGLVLYLLETPTLPCTLGEVLRQSSGCGQPLDKHLKAVIAERAAGDKPLSGPCVDALNRFVSNSDNAAASIKSPFDAPLSIFANPIVDAATSADDLSLRDVRRRRMSIYIGIQPNRLASASRLINLFFSQLVNQNTDVLPERDPQLKSQCLLVQYEFTVLGRVSVIAKSVAFIAGYNLRLMPIVQSIAQLEAVYGKEETRNFVTNHDVQIVCPPREQKDANEVSEMLGYLTEKTESTGLSKGRTPASVVKVAPADPRRQPQGKSDAGRCRAALSAIS